MRPPGCRSSVNRTVVMPGVDSVSSNTPTGRPGDDLELQPGGRVEHGDPVVAVDLAAAWAGEDLAVGRSLPAAG